MSSLLVAYQSNDLPGEPVGPRPRPGKGRHLPIMFLGQNRLTMLNTTRPKTNSA